METALGWTLFVELPHVRAVADFYAAAFGAAELATHDVAGQLAAVEMCLGGVTLTVAGANPKRQADPSRGGPFHPPAAGTVSAIAQLAVADLDSTLSAAIDAGATVRDPAQLDAAGRSVATVFDPAGHIWALIERKAADMAKAA